MDSEIKQAFAHPGARASHMAETEGRGPRDRIMLRDYVTQADIGAFQAERGAPQRLRFNVVVEVTTHARDAADDVDRILSYDRVTEAIEAELIAERLNLLETLAERVADRVLAEPQATRAFVRVEKLDRGPGSLGVEIVRARDGGSTAPNAELEAAPHPVVAVLSNAAIARPDFSAWLDGMPGPLILCVGMPEGGVPRGGRPLVQRRIDLLALDQNAWVLAGRDKRCVVVGTRTELDWAMRHEKISVWAPSKMVLDSFDAPEDGVDARALVTWFAQEMQADQVIEVGA